LSAGNKDRSPKNPVARTAIGILLALVIFGAWLALHIYSVFYVSLTLQDAGLAVLLIALLCWLYVGLFIVAHDCMHGSLAPSVPWLNRPIGQLALFIYAGFHFDALAHKHVEHHRHAGTGDDPDFDERPPHGFWQWYAKFFSEYFSLRELFIIAAAVAVYVVVLGATYPNIIVFWALPALLSSLQLFYFGTYLPHRPGPDTFSDWHRTRSSEFNWLLSLLTCFHFGYHHAHHLNPGVPWWGLPKARRAAATARPASTLPTES
jgi:beta-carotene/zeaxanthin 4-ketolase